MGEVAGWKISEKGWWHYFLYEQSACRRWSTGTHFIDGTRIMGQATPGAKVCETCRQRWVRDVKRQALANAAREGETGVSDCGCLPTIHPYQTHEAHMDDLTREANQGVLEQAARSDPWTARALLYRFAELEIVRLEAKQRFWRHRS